METPETLYPRVEQAVADLAAAVRLAATGDAPDWPRGAAALEGLSLALGLLRSRQPASLPRGPVKQVIVVRTDLAMPSGKQVAQGAHGSVNALAKEKGAYIVPTGAGFELRVPLDVETATWLDTDYRKIVLGISSEAALLTLHEKARAAGLRCHLVQDNGLTVFNGQKTFTALAIGPHEDARIDALTKRLRLLVQPPVKRRYRRHKQRVAA